MTGERRGTTIANVRKGGSYLIAVIVGAFVASVIVELGVGRARSVVQKGIGLRLFDLGPIEALTEGYFIAWLFYPRQPGGWFTPLVLSVFVGCVLVSVGLNHRRIGGKS